jgi:hypothetical protein
MTIVASLSSIALQSHRIVNDTDVRDLLNGKACATLSTIGSDPWFAALYIKSLSNVGISPHFCRAHSHELIHVASSAHQFPNVTFRVEKPIQIQR